MACFLGQYSNPFWKGLSQLEATWAWTGQAATSARYPLSPFSSDGADYYPELLRGSAEPPRLNEYRDTFALAQHE